MKEGELEKVLLDFLIECLWYSIKKWWPLIVLCPLLILVSSHNKIQSIPKRFAVRGVVKMGYLKIRSFKSNILEKEDESSELEPYQRAMGLTKGDLQVVMASKFINHRGRMRSIWDKGPFVTKVEFPEKSNLIIIEVESEDRNKGEAIVNEIIDFLQNSFSKNKKKFERIMKDRMMVLKKDHKRVLKSLKELAIVEAEFGYTPILAKQKKDLSIMESRIRYMLIDISDQLDPTNIQEFKIISQAKGVYPVTKRRALFYGASLIIGMLLYIFCLLVLSILRFRELPPAIPRDLLERSEQCS